MTDEVIDLKRCFVVSPIGAESSPERKHADMVLNSIIKEALPSFDVKRADDFGAPDMITDKIIEALTTYELVVADLTQHNPNVFYEIGIRHAVALPIIPMKGDGDKIPFDNMGINTIFYDVSDWNSHIKTRKALAKAAEQVLQASYQVSNPVTHANSYIKLSASSDPKDEVISKLLDNQARLQRQVSGIEKKVNSWPESAINSLGYQSAFNDFKKDARLLGSFDYSSDRSSEIKINAADLASWLNYKTSFPLTEPSEGSSAVETKVETEKNKP